MAPRKDKDMRRADLVVPYQEPPSAGDTADFNTTISTTLPMAAMFTRNKFIGWGAVVFSIQSWLGESSEQKKNASMPGYLNIMLSVAALGVSYLPLFLPQTGGTGGTATSAAPPPKA